MRLAAHLQEGLHRGDDHEQPQTIGYALTDTPVGLAAWMLDHDADSYEKISHAFLDGQPSGGLTRDTIVDNITLYWLTNTATSSARLYWENARTIVAAIASGEKPPELSLPVAFTVFPGEIFQAPRELGREGLSQPDLLQRGRQGRPLRGVGGAAAVRRGDASRVQVTPQREVVMSSTAQTATEIRTFNVERSGRRAGRPPSTHRRRRAGPTGRRMPRKACSSRRSRHWPPIGPRITTGASSRSASPPCRTSSPRSTGWTSTSSTCALSMRMRCR